MKQTITIIILKEGKMEVVVIMYIQLINCEGPAEIIRE